nr:hypothetical protein DBT53_11210 [Aerococcus mictus]
MSSFMLISSRDPFECGDTENFYRLAVDLKTGGSDVTLFLVQNGVLPARDGAENLALRQVVHSGVRVVADEFSLRERAVGGAELADGIAAVSLERVVDALAAGAKTIWH